MLAGLVLQTLQLRKQDFKLPVEKKVYWNTGTMHRHTSICTRTLKLVLPLGCTRKENNLANERDCIAVTRCDLIVRSVMQISPEVTLIGDVETTIKLLLRPRQLSHISHCLSLLPKTKYYLQQSLSTPHILAHISAFIVSMSIKKQGKASVPSQPAFWKLFICLFKVSRPKTEILLSFISVTTLFLQMVKFFILHWLVSTDKTGYLCSPIMSLMISDQT